MSHKHVLVTGATGFIGARVVDSLLARGLHVTGTTRGPRKAEQMKLARPQYADKLDFVIIRDLGDPGVFDEALKGDVDAVVHCASPIDYSIVNVEVEMLLPAINGTKSILAAAAAHPSVTRIVITSSFAAVLDLAKLHDPQKTFTADDWNPITYEEAKTGNARTAYFAAKKYAELAAREFVEKEKPGFDLVTICPPLVYGPIVHPLEKLADLPESMAPFWRVASGATPPREIQNIAVKFWIDVRDLAEAHVEAVMKPEVGGDRLIIAAGDKWSHKLFSEIVREEFDWAKGREKVEEPVVEESSNVDWETGAKKLGLKYRDLRTMVVETTKQLKEMEEKGM